MIDTFDKYLDQSVHLLGKLNGLPGYVLVFLWCIAFGYAMRAYNKFPNDAIPFAVILWGCIWNGMIADAAADDLPLRIWLVKNVVVGGIIGLIAWGVHHFGLSRLEEKMPWLRKAVARRSDSKLEYEAERVEEKAAEINAQKP